jgi:acyl-CoA reductase-like NAD-dependent aldehyde dehydrogenase
VTTLAGATRSFDSVNPASGAVVGTFPVHDGAAVAGAVSTAREAARWWDGLGFPGRRARLLAWKRALATELDGLAELVNRENGKSVDEATLEIVAHLSVLGWLAEHAETVLRTRRARPNLFTVNQSATLARRPFGVVGVIGTWNWPVYTPGGALASALAAGNAVVYKPSELTPAVGSRVVELFRSVVPEAPVLSTVTGFGPTGAALPAAGVDKLSFVGSPATARRVMESCAQTLTPLVLELGGKDAMIVADDADLAAAVDGALWLGLGNSGQTCIGTEIVYVVRSRYEAFLGELARGAERVRAGGDEPSSYGPMVMPSQVEIVRRHVQDALERGARAVVGGLGAFRPPYIDPIVLVDVPADAPARAEETFGPVLVVVPVDDVDEAVARVNEGPFGLGAAVYSRRSGRDIAARLRCGMVSVNGIIAYTIMGELPFGGVGHSGFGRVHGAAGLEEFTWVKTTVRARFPAPVNPTSLFRSRLAMREFRALARFAHRR